VRLAVLAVALLAVLAGPARAWASANGETGLEDERLLLGDPSGAADAVAAWKALGVDVVRLHARWGAIAPGRARPVKPAGFDAADPDDPAYDWAVLDQAVGLVRAADMKVMLTITGPGPLWTSRNPRLHNPLYDPNPVEFARFARAVALRYKGTVSRYLIWNEPNQPGWLQPQNACRGRACTPVAPHLYRGLVRTSERAIHDVDPAAEVVIGELAPIGGRPRTSRTPVAPLPFLRLMGCVDALYRPIRAGRCRGFKPAGGDSFGYHPHPRLLAPDQPNPDRDEAQFGDLGRLFTVLDKLTAHRRILSLRGGRLGVHLTEFGYQTSPPDHAVGIPLTLQNRYLQQAAYIAWRSPRIRGLTFYEWEDEPVHYTGPGSKAYSGWQSGLHFITGRPKPALTTFADPFVIDLPPGRRTARLWGQVRPGGVHEVTLLRRLSGQADFSPFATVMTNAAGYFARTEVIDPGAEYRYSWLADAAGSASAVPEERRSGIVDLRLRAARSQRAAAATAP
jgi:hypothetical protein